MRLEDTILSNARFSFINMTLWSILVLGFVLCSKYWPKFKFHTLDVKNKRNEQLVLCKTGATSAKGSSSVNATTNATELKLAASELVNQYTIDIEYLRGKNQSLRVPLQELQKANLDLEASLGKLRTKLNSILQIRDQINTSLNYTSSSATRKLGTVCKVWVQYIFHYKWVYF